MDASEAAICSISGFDASGVLTDREVAALFAQLPPSHIASTVLRSIEYVDEVKEETDPGSRRFTKYQVLGDCAVGDDARARVYRQHASGNPEEFMFRHTILHEVGHAVYAHRLNADDRREWATLHGDSLMFYNEQSRVPDEHFSNLYGAYVLRHEFVRKGFRRLFPFLSGRVFEGSTY